MVSYLSSVIHYLFVTYTTLIFLRIISSWFPVWQAHQVVRFIVFYTEPYLSLFRRILPPLGGVLDLSPILAFFALRLLEMMILLVLNQNS
jgi:YggT family protein